MNARVAHQLGRTRRQVYKLGVALRLDGGHDGTSDGPPCTSLGEERSSPL